MLKTLCFLLNVHFKIRGELLRFLLASGADANIGIEISVLNYFFETPGASTDSRKMPLLAWTTRFARKECAQILMQANADLLFRDENNQAIGIFSAAESPKEMLPLFISAMQARGLLEIRGILDCDEPGPLRRFQVGRRLC